MTSRFSTRVLTANRSRSSNKQQEQELQQPTRALLHHGYASIDEEFFKKAV